MSWTRSNLSNRDCRKALLWRIHVWFKRGVNNVWKQLIHLQIPRVQQRKESKSALFFQTLAGRNSGRQWWRYRPEEHWLLLCFLHDVFFFFLFFFVLKIIQSEFPVRKMCMSMVCVCLMLQRTTRSVNKLQFLHLLLFFHPWFLSFWGFQAKRNGMRLLSSSDFFFLFVCFFKVHSRNNSSL